MCAREQLRARYNLPSPDKPLNQEKTGVVNVLTRMARTRIANHDGPYVPAAVFEEIHGRREHTTVRRNPAEHNLVPARLV
jgi:hypothetical protein